MKVGIAEAKRTLSSLINRVAFGRERIVLVSRGRPKAALVSIEDLLLLESPGRSESCKKAPEDAALLRRQLGSLGLEPIAGELVSILKNHGVVRAAVFGSRARGTAGAKSDLDLLVEFREGKTLLDLAELQMALKENLGVNAHVVTYAALHPAIREKVLQEQVVIL
ncbi:MAG: type II toxin-antitoxin system prevent-host-death family antitoxin [Desulfotomaculales bacterium]